MAEFAYRLEFRSTYHCISTDPQNPEPSGLAPPLPACWFLAMAARPGSKFTEFQPTLPSTRSLQDPQRPELRLCRYQTGVLLFARRRCDLEPPGWQSSVWRLHQHPDQSAKHRRDLCWQCLIKLARLAAAFTARSMPARPGRASIPKSAVFRARESGHWHSTRQDQNTLFVGSHSAGVYVVPRELRQRCGRQSLIDVKSGGHVARNSLP